MPFCHMHGPEHNVMVGAALLTAYKNADGDIDLSAALTEMMNRGKRVPGGACGSWDFVDPDRIVLLGGSMGGLVTTVVGSGHQDEIAGMILMYPALSAKADSGAERYKSEDEIPEDVSLFGGWIHVGKNYITDLGVIKNSLLYHPEIVRIMGFGNGSLAALYHQKK